MKTACALCGSGDAPHLFTKNGWRLCRCGGCGLVRLDPMPAAEQIAARYSLAAGYHLSRLGRPTRYTRWELERAEHLAGIIGAPSRSRTRLLDIGCSTGDFMARARTRGWDVQGIDVAKHLAVFARVKRGLAVEHASVDHVVERFGAQSFDAITGWDVIEHLPDPLHALRALASALRPGGTLWLSTPNLAGWVPRYHWRLLRPLTGRWPHPEPPLHLHQFTVATMARALATVGFEAVRFRHDAIPLWYTSGFDGPPQLRQWLSGEPSAPRSRAIYLITAPVFLAAQLFGRGDSMIVAAVKPPR